MTPTKETIFFKLPLDELKRIRAGVDSSGLTPRTFYRAAWLRAAGAGKLADAILAERSELEALPANVGKRSKVDGRIAKPRAPVPKTPSIEVKVPVEEYALIQSAIAATGLTPSDWFRMMTLLAVGDESERSKRAELVKQLRRLDQRAA